MNIKKEPPKDPKTIFSQGLFWDAEEIDLDLHSDYVIARVLDFGDEEDLKKLRLFFPDEKLIQVIKERRGLHPMTVRFWSIYFNLPQPEKGHV
jgi:hypothetical protein